MTNTNPHSELIELLERERRLADEAIQSLQVEIEALKHDLARVMKRENDFLNENERLREGLRELNDCVERLDMDSATIALFDQAQRKARTLLGDS